MGYRTTRHVRHDGKLYAPGKTIGKLTDGQAERLLKIGAIKKSGSAAKEEDPGAPETGGESSGNADAGGDGNAGGNAAGKTAAKSAAKSATKTAAKSAAKG